MKYHTTVAGSRSVKQPVAPCRNCGGEANYRKIGTGMKAKYQYHCVRIGCNYGRKLTVRLSSLLAWNKDNI